MCAHCQASLPSHTHTHRRDVPWQLEGLLRLYLGHIFLPASKATSSAPLPRSVGLHLAAATFDLWPRDIQAISLHAAPSHGGRG